MRSVNSTGNVIYAFITPAITSFSMSIYVGQDKCTSQFVVTWGETANTNTIMAWTVWGCYLVIWNCSWTRYIDLWQQHIFVRAKLSWNGHPVHIETNNGVVLSKGPFKLGSDKELGPFSILRSVMLLKQSDFFTFCHLMQSMLWIKRCCQGGQMNAFSQFCGRWSVDS